MEMIAPNLCQLLGSLIASKIISIAGGIDKLATIPACNIQVMGGQRSNQIGFSQMQRNHTGIFNQLDMVKNAPKRYIMQLVRMLATNTSKCARADYLGTQQNLGLKLSDEMLVRFEKIQQEGGLLRIDKPRDIPGQQPKKKRGGKRHRKNKQLYEISQIRKNQNKMKFGQQMQQEIQQGIGFGMLKTGIGKLKINIKKQKLNLSKKMQIRMNKKTGIQSSLDLSSAQGIELINPYKIENSKKNNNRTIAAGGGGTDSYFSRQTGFKTVINNKL